MKKIILGDNPTARPPLSLFRPLLLIHSFFFSPGQLTQVHCYEMLHYVTSVIWNVGGLPSCLPYQLSPFLIASIFFFGIYGVLIQLLQRRMP
jgi:hypothetical protein